MVLDPHRALEEVKKGNRIFPVVGHLLGIFDRDILRKVDKRNFRDLCMAPKFLDSILNRPDPSPVPWREVRAAYFEATKMMSNDITLGCLYDRMASVAAQHVGQLTDMTLFAERVISEPLIDLVIEGATLRDKRILLRDQQIKIRNVIYPPGDQRHGRLARFPRTKRWKEIFGEILAGRVISRRLKRFTDGHAEPTGDYTSSLVPLLPRLGINRASYAITTILTAIAGAPGTVAACILYEIARRPDQAVQVRNELNGAHFEAVLHADEQRLPLTNAFIFEAMRLWSFPLVVQRNIFHSFEESGHEFQVGDAYFLSAFIMHRDPSEWPEPDEFDLGRWIGDQHATSKKRIMPFGWGPRTCIGASIGLRQYFMFLHILTQKMDVRWNRVCESKMRVAGIAVPENLLATLEAN